MMLSRSVASFLLNATLFPFPTSLHPFDIGKQAVLLTIKDTG